MGGGALPSMVDPPLILSTDSIMIYGASPHHTNLTTGRIGIIEPNGRTLELPFLIRSGSFFFFSWLGMRGSVFAVSSSPYLRDGIPDASALRFNFSSSCGSRPSTGRSYPEHLMLGIFGNLFDTPKILNCVLSRLPKFLPWGKNKAAGT